jgi:hypothetical protein
MTMSADGVDTEALAAFQRGFEIPPETFDDTFLRAMHREGLARVGLMTLFMDEHGNFLMLQHDESEKCDAGMWGVLGETSKAQPDGEGWRLEAPVRTVIRGLWEELGVTAEAYELRTFADNAVFDMTWPVGVRNPGQRVYALCPTFIISDELRQRILDTSPPKGEILDRAFFTAEQAMTLGSFRPGMVEWFMKFDEVSRRRGSVLVSVATPPELDESQGEIEDAILANMYGPPRANRPD